MKKRITMSSWKTGFYGRECQCPPCLKCGKRANGADSNAFSHRESYYCEDCKEDHKQKQCKKCEKWKSLTCYPESVREKVAKFRNVFNKHHWCTECNESEGKPNKPNESTLKQCLTCERWKSLTSYPESIREIVATTGHIKDKHHDCTECVESKKSTRWIW